MGHPVLRSSKKKLDISLAVTIQNNFKIAFMFFKNGLFWNTALRSSTCCPTSFVKSNKNQFSTRLDYFLFWQRIFFLLLSKRVLNDVCIPEFDLVTYHSSSHTLNVNLNLGKLELAKLF